jgi:rare lipoprotein A
MPRAATPSIGRTFGQTVGLVAALLLAACASAPPEPARGVRPPPASSTSSTPPAAPAPTPAPMASPTDRDGAELRPPPDLEKVPDAEPRLEPIRDGGPNKPYEVAGQAYVPIVKDDTFTERGMASWYGRQFHGRRTASGEVYNMYAMTAAHKTLPIPSYARVRNPASGAEILVRVNDRGPFVRGRIVDLSYTAALKLGVLRNPTTVEVERITFEDIRTGAWRRDAISVAATAVEPVAMVVATGAPIAVAPVAPAYTAPARGFWVQLGAFRERKGAEDFQRRVMADHDWLTPLLAVFIDLPLFRLQAGPYPSRDEARGAAEQIRGALKLVPVIVERR